MQIKPIKTAADYADALDKVNSLWQAQPNTAKGDALEILITLIEAYEAKHQPLDAPDPIAYLEYLMESRGMTRAELGQYLGGKSRVSEVLNGKRQLSLTMIKNLHFKLGISADLLI